MKPICILGMHRSGTSMTANLLAKCGVSFGFPGELLNANASNTLGYFEHERITYEVNEALLSHFGGSWKNPPKLPSGWETSPELKPFRDRTLSIISELESQSHWGWKDPRTSLLLPFWQALLPEMRYIICLRNPIDVAKSLESREGMSFSDNSILWLRYVNDAINNTADKPRLIIFYEDFFKETRTTVQRLVEFAKKEETFSDSTISRLCDTIFTKLRHHQSSPKELSENIEIDNRSKLLFEQLYQDYGISDDSTSSALKNKTQAISGIKDSSPVPNYPMIFPKYENPTVSIVIPTYNRVSLLGACLRSILQSTKLPFQLIIVNDCSSDETDQLLNKLVNVDIVVNDENLDFLRSANLGADKAKGKYIVFLNNDVTVRSGWLTTLVDTIENQPDCGAVGAKLVSMDGKLQEAGCAIWPDGSVTLAGNSEDPFKPEYSYLREVDYCSGACLLVDRHLFHKLGKFDLRYAPAYYEDVDLCMSIREAGKKVIYQPATTVFHHHMGSRSLKKVQDLLDQNRSIFRRKWQNELAFRSNIKNTFFARNNCIGRRVLFFCLSLPEFDLEPDIEGFSNNMFDASIGLAKLSYAVSLITPKTNPLPRADLQDLQQSGIEVFQGNKINFESLLLDRANQYDFVIYNELTEHPHITHLIKTCFPGASLGYTALLKKLTSD
jgi:GT2 family glycosyltransferase